MTVLYTMNIKVKVVL